MHVTCVQQQAPSPLGDAGRRFSQRLAEPYWPTKVLVQAHSQKIRESVWSPATRCVAALPRRVGPLLCALFCARPFDCQACRRRGAAGGDRRLAACSRHDQTHRPIRRQLFAARTRVLERSIKSTPHSLVKRLIITPPHRPRLSSRTNKQRRTLSTSPPPPAPHLAPDYYTCAF